MSESMKLTRMFSAFVRKHRERRAHQALEEHPPDTIEIAPRIDSARRGELLGCGVERRTCDVAHPGALHRRREAEVDEADRARAVDDDVARLHVAMNEPDVVHRAEDARELRRDIEDLRGLQGADRKHIGERFALDELHDEVGQPLDFADLEDVRGKPGVPLPARARPPRGRPRASTERASSGSFHRACLCVP